MGWQYYGSLAGLTDKEVNDLPDPGVSIKTIDSYFTDQGGIPLVGGGLVTQNNVKQALAKLAYAMYGTVTRDTILAVPLRWVSGKDIFDDARPILAAIPTAVGAVFAPVTFGASLAAGGLLSSAIAKNATGSTAALTQGQMNSGYGSGFTSKLQSDSLINSQSKTQQQNVSSNQPNNSGILIALVLGFISILIIFFVTRK